MDFEPSSWIDGEEDPRMRPRLRGVPPTTRTTDLSAVPFTHPPFVRSNPPNVPDNLIPPYPREGEDVDPIRRFRYIQTTRGPASTRLNLARPQLSAT
ncbi:hypothetical protein FA13DRAFT_507033 [Coprinellus micaceus]|uniref:Uncharacterized protein n=1 Tax=Coprinellus micaceus TaxID=71717 RepID=A0A4Y7SCL2_COPMI|nr:hypothetical protein FA13DRAFT_507033 [Coprinellus micaceus]